MHQLIQSAAKRASQRVLIQQTGKSYLRNLRIKQFMIGVFVAAVTTAGLVYWVQSRKAAEKEETKPLAVVNTKENQEELNPQDTIINQPAQAGDKSSLIQSSDWNAVEEGRNWNTASFKSQATKTIGKPVSRSGMTNTFKQVSLGNPLPADSLTREQIPTEVVLGYPDKEFPDEVVMPFETLKLSKQYDSIGRFNDLYCGYALVMDEQKFGFIDYRGNEFIPLIYDEIVVSSNIKSSKNKRKGHLFGKKQKRKVLYIPKRSGKDVRDCEDEYIRLERNRDSLK
jgi:hypothetical protein